MTFACHSRGARLAEDDDYDEYDRVMAEDARVAVLVAPDRILGVV